MNDITISIWQAIIATAGGVTIAVLLPLLVAFFTFRRYVNSLVKAETDKATKDIREELKEAKTRLDRLIPFERFYEEQAHQLKDKPNPPVTRKNELLDKWHSQTLTYPESMELKGILEQESSQGDEALKALIVIALIGLGLYILTHKE